MEFCLFVLFIFVYFACITTFITVFSLERPEKIMSKIFKYHQGFRSEFLFESGRCHECQISENSSYILGNLHAVSRNYSTLVVRWLLSSSLLYCRERLSRHFAYLVFLYKPAPQGDRLHSYYCSLLDAWRRLWARYLQESHCYVSEIYLASFCTR